MPSFLRAPRGRLRHIGALAAAMAAAPLVAVNNDPIYAEVLDTTPIVTAPETNLINPGGKTLMVTFKGQGLTDTATPSKVSLVVRSPGYDASGNATTIDRTLVGVGHLRKPLPPTYANGQTKVVGSRCIRKVTNSQIYTCTQQGPGVTANAPVHTSGTVVGADGYGWLYIGKITDNSAQVLTYMPKIALDDGSGNAKVPFTLSEPIYQGDTIISITITAGAYGSSNVSRSGILTWDNHSNLAYPPVFVAPLYHPWSIEGATLHNELVAHHEYAQNGRPVAAVRFIVRNPAGAVAITGGWITDLSLSTLTASTNKVQCFAENMDISGQSDAGFYAREFEVYPWLGNNPYKSHDDGLGPAAGSLAVSSKMVANVSRCVPFRKDAANAYGRAYAYVDPSVTDDTTGQASTNPATAAAAPFKTVSGAIKSTSGRGIQSYSNTTFSRNNVGNHEVRLKAGDYTDTWGGDLTSTVTVTDVLFRIVIDPAASPGTVNIKDSATAANKKGPIRTWYEGLLFTGTATQPAIDNQVSGSAIGEFSSEQVFKSCTFAGNTTQRGAARMGLTWLYDCTITGGLASWFGDNRSALKLDLGSTWDGQCQSTAINAFGHKMLNGAFSAAHFAKWWAEGTGTVQTDLKLGMWGFYSHPKCRAISGQNPKYANGASGTNRQHFAVGVVQFMWEVEVYDVGGLGSSKGGETSADSVTEPMPYLLATDVTIAGEGLNIGYCENGLTFYEKNWRLKRAALMDLNSKGELYEGGAEVADEHRVGNLLSRFGCGSTDNAIFAPTDSAASPKNLSGEAFPPSWLVGGASGTGGALDPLWTLDRSWTSAGAKTGDGDYRATSASPHRGMITAAKQAWKYDLGGALRKTDGVPGAREWA
jgi:hypothetical protein